MTGLGPNSEAQTAEARPWISGNPASDGQPGRCDGKTHKLGLHAVITFLNLEQLPKLFFTIASFTKFQLAREFCRQFPLSFHNHISWVTIGWTRCKLCQSETDNLDGNNTE